MIGYVVVLFVLDVCLVGGWDIEVDVDQVNLNLLVLMFRCVVIFFSIVFFLWFDFVIGIGDIESDQIDVFGYLCVIWVIFDIVEFVGQLVVVGNVFGVFEYCVSCLFDDVLLIEFVECGVVGDD